MTTYVDTATGKALAANDPRTLATETDRIAAAKAAQAAFDQRSPRSKAQDRCSECGHQEHNRACLAEGPHRTRHGRQYGCYCPSIGGATS